MSTLRSALMLPILLSSPKRSSTKELKDFRPTSLIGSVYKIISKKLTEMLKKVTDELFNGNQVAFLEGRQIMDALPMISGL
uniref:Putative ovule protein n=1 Tax=Solanum chacoense TaxID=4108 RepID=A0A0V0GJY9_SOLCH